MKIFLPCDEILSEFFQLLSGSSVDCSQSFVDSSLDHFLPVLA